MKAARHKVALTPILVKKKKTRPRLKKGQGIPAVHRTASSKGPDPFHHTVPSYPIAKAKDSHCAQLEVPPEINHFTLAYSYRKANQLLPLANKCPTRHRKRGSLAR